MEHPQPLEEELDEIRIALVMTGGVSLAVWMGGVATELNRLIARDGPYGELLDLTRCKARVDVIGGTSAGGVNGAFLATAVAHRTDVGRLRPVWLELGSLSALLRSPAEEDPPSLLRGDDYFLPSLRDAFRSLEGTPTDPAEDPMHLVITTTLLESERRSFQDDYGGRIRDRSHRGTFTFRRGNGWDRDDFADPGASDRLAVAARSTASFPGAFEPHYIWVGADGEGSAHPDMARHVDFGSSGFVIDGGVLMNKPLRPVLRAIFANRSEGHGRRVLAYVLPDPSLPVARPGATGPQAVPRMTKVVMAGMHIPGVESVSEDLESIRTHNQRVLAQRRLRRSLLGLDVGETDGRVDLVDLAVQLYPAYLGTRKDYSAVFVLDELARGLRVPGADGSDLQREGAPPWDRRRIRAALLDVLGRFLPPGFPATRGTTSTWDWDVAGVESASSAARDLVRAGLLLAPDDDEGSAEARRALSLCRQRLREIDGSLRRLRRDDMTFWRAQVAAVVQALASADDSDEALRTWAESALQASPGEMRSAALIEMAEAVAAVLASAREPLMAVADRPGRSGAGASSAASLRAMVGRVCPSPGPAELPDSAEEAAARTLRRLLAVVVVEAALAAGEPVVEQEVELLQISAEAPNGFDQRRTGQEKLAGLQLSHFGAFYKRSWRANDWMWGRMDAVPNLVRIVLNPAGLRRRVTLEPSFGAAFSGRFREVCLQAEDEEARRVLAAAWEDEAVDAELAFLRDPGLPLPPALPVCTAAMMRRIQLRILQEELPHVAGSIRQDAGDGAAVQPDAASFLQAVQRAQGGATTGAPVDEDVPLSPSAAVELLPTCEIGRERLAGEANSALYKRILNTASAVGLRAAHGQAQDPNAPRGSKMSVRRSWPVASPLVGSIASKSMRVFVTMVVLLAAGVGLLGYGLAPDSPRVASTLIGSILLAIGLILAVVRIPVRRQLIALGVAGMTGVILLLSLLLPGDTFFQSGAFRIAVAVAMGVVTVCLGGWPRRVRT